MPDWNEWKRGSDDEAFGRLESINDFWNRDYQKGREDERNFRNSITGVSSPKSSNSERSTDDRWSYDTSGSSWDHSNSSEGHGCAFALAGMILGGIMLIYVSPTGNDMVSVAGAILIFFALCAILGGRSSGGTFSIRLK